MSEPVILKIGGSLIENNSDDNLRRLGRIIAEFAKEKPVWIVPGGGPFADLVRRIGEKYRLKQETCHFMALAAMEQYAFLLKEFIAGSVVADLPDIIQPVPVNPSSLASDFSGPQILLLSRCLSQVPEQILPRSWEVTSDSVSAFLAQRLDAPLLVILKSTDIDPALKEPDIDPFFHRLLPLNCPVWFINGQYPERLADLLQNGNARGVLLPARSHCAQEFL